MHLLSYNLRWMIVLMSLLLVPHASMILQEETNIYHLLRGSAHPFIALF